MSPHPPPRRLGFRIAPTRCSRSDDSPCYRRSPVKARPTHVQQHLRTVGWRLLLDLHPSAQAQRLSAKRQRREALHQRGEGLHRRGRWRRSAPRKAAARHPSAARMRGSRHSWHRPRTIRAELRPPVRPKRQVGLAQRRAPAERARVPRRISSVEPQARAAQIDFVARPQPLAARRLPAGTSIARPSRIPACRIRSHRRRCGIRRHPA